MRYAIAAPEYDPLGHVEIETLPSTTEGETRRRVTRTPTLDGGCAIYDAGHAEADRTMDIAWTVTDRVQEERIARLVRLYPRLRVMCHAGSFLAAPEAYTPGREESRLRLLILSKLSA